MGKKKANKPSKMSLHNRQHLRLNRLNSALESTPNKVTGNGTDLNQYSDYLFKVYIPTRATQRFPSLSKQSLSNLMKYLVVGPEVWQLITSDGSVDSAPQKWPGLATFRHAKAIDTILDRYKDVLNFEEGRQLFLVNFAQVLARSLEQTTVDPPPPVNTGVKVPVNVSVEAKVSLDHPTMTDVVFKENDSLVQDGSTGEYVRPSKEYLEYELYQDNVEKELRKLSQDYATINILQDIGGEGTEYAGQSMQVALTPTLGIIATGTPGGKDPEAPWPLYTNPEIIDVILDIERLYKIANYRNEQLSKGIIPNGCTELTELYNVPQLIVTLLFYHPIIPGELKSIFPDIQLLYPETVEELEYFKKKYVPDDKGIDILNTMNMLLGLQLDQETGAKIMTTLLSSTTLNNETLEALDKLGLSDEKKIEGIGNMVMFDDYDMFNLVEEGLGDKVKALVTPILQDFKSNKTNMSTADEGTVPQTE